MKLLPDTNVLIYDTIEDCEHHSLAADIIDKAAEIYMLPIVVHEYIWVMLKLVQASPSFVSVKVQEYLEDPKTVYMLENVDVLTNSLRIIEEDKQNIKEVNDYIILATALKYNLTLATFDKKLKKTASERKLKVIP
jgi:predicted nucleic acid-binding protein